VEDPVVCRAVENLKKTKSPNFRFLGILEKNLKKIKSLDSQLQQKIVAFQSN